MQKYHTGNFFFALTPEKVLGAVEDAGLRCNLVCMPLNSYENRVYDIQLEDETRVVAKFYRPGRWTREQILEEHAFMQDLDNAEVAICSLRRFPDGSTLKQTEGIYYCLYDRFGGRAPQDIGQDLAERLGMMLGRLHSVGAIRSSEHRVRLDADTYVRADLDWMLQNATIPAHLSQRYATVANTIADLAEEKLTDVPVLRIHGDLHAGNLLMRDDMLYMLDFDDHVLGPAVQDFWLLLQGRGREASQLMDTMIDGYETFFPFNRGQLCLIEPLRAMRRIHYTAWLARRWHDPVFPLTWPHFSGESYWTEEVADLEEMVDMIRSGSGKHNPLDLAVDSQAEFTNADFFWDMKN